MNSLEIWSQSRDIVRPKCENSGSLVLVGLFGEGFGLGLVHNVLLGLVSSGLMTRVLSRPFTHSISIEEKLLFLSHWAIKWPYQIAKLQSAIQI